MKRQCSSTYRPNGTTLRCELPRGHQCAHTTKHYWWHDREHQPEPNIHWTFGCVVVLGLLAAIVTLWLRYHP